MKIIWISSIIVVFLSMLWFLFGATAFFQREVGLITTFLFITVWIPALIFVIISVFLILKKWEPKSQSLQEVLCVVIVCLSIFFSSTLITNASPSGWLTERVTRDWLQITSDENYEYRIELINRFQKNNYTRLFVKNTETGDEIIIRLDISTYEFSGGGEGSITPAPAIPPARMLMSEMIPTEQENIYTLNALKNLNIVGVFEIDMETMTSRRIE